MTEKKEMLLIEKTQWEAIVSKVRDLTLKVSILKDKCVAQPQYYNNKELCKVLGVERRSQPQRQLLPERLLQRRLRL